MAKLPELTDRVSSAPLDKIVIRQEIGDGRGDEPVTTVLIKHADGEEEVIWLTNWVVNIEIDNNQVANVCYKNVNS